MKTVHHYPYNNRPPSQRHSDTSQDAADKIEGTVVTTLQQKLLIYLQILGADGATDEEMQDKLKMRPNTQRPRRRELQLNGLVIDSGERRKTNSGRKAVVWIYNKTITDSPPLTYR